MDIIAPKDGRTFNILDTCLEEAESGVPTLIVFKTENIYTKDGDNIVCCDNKLLGIKTHTFKYMDESGDRTYDMENYVKQIATYYISKKIMPKFYDNRYISFRYITDSTKGANCLIMFFNDDDYKSVSDVVISLLKPVEVAPRLDIKQGSGRRKRTPLV